MSYGSDEAETVSPGVINTPIRAAMPEQARRDPLAQAASPPQVLCYQQCVQLEDRRDRPRYPPYHQSLPPIVAAAGAVHSIRSI
jgi:hypothetical protein